MTGSPRPRRAATWASAFSGVPTSSTSPMTRSAAPPCTEPEKAAMAAVSAAVMLARQPMATRAVNAEALDPWSAWTTKPLSITRTEAGVGFSPAAR
ncbi:hypothetical protein SMICM17S_12232 [Streptomyces microflavus]